MEVAKANTAAIRIPYVVSSSYAKWRPNSWGWSASSTVPAAAEAPNRQATKTRPLPRKTVETNRSSASPACSRRAPMNHRKAMPAKGTSSSAVVTASRCPAVTSTRSAPPPSGRAIRARTIAAAMRAAKRIPASPAARGCSESVPGASPVLLVSFVQQAGARPWCQWDRAPG